MNNSAAKDLKDIVVKLQDIDKAFRFGEKMLPLIEGFVSFISDFIPFIEQVSGSIEDSRAKIPEAANQIDKVTNATELAMTEVLDKIDEINEELACVSENIGTIDEKNSKSLEVINELKEKFKDDIETKRVLKRIARNLDIKKQSGDVKNKIQDIMANTDQITMSLQVQDITAQQLAAVNHMIISIQHKLSNLLEAVDASDYKSGDSLKRAELPGEHFDSSASYTEGVKQNEVDEVINSINVNASQEEIDKLFS
ncbi:MAG: hypothetical protein CR986_01605 [Ignavibacteriae bacterium]|nr:MAG: hypothetical protein CR986_01605 [Ignavibacteriota bacterium]